MKSARDEVRQWAQTAADVGRTLGIVCVCAGKLLSGEVVDRARYLDLLALGLTDQPSFPDEGGAAAGLSEQDDSLFLENVTMLVSHGTQLRLPYVRISWDHLAACTLMRARPEFGRPTAPAQAKLDVLLN